VAARTCAQGTQINSLLSIDADQRLELAFFNSLYRPYHFQFTPTWHPFLRNGLVDWGVMLLVALQDMGDQWGFRG